MNRLADAINALQNLYKYGAQPWIGGAIGHGIITQKKWDAVMTEAERVLISEGRKPGKPAEWKPATPQQ